MFKKFLWAIIMICILLSGCTEKSADYSEPDKKILLTVNGDPLYKDEFEKIAPHYKENGYTESEIIEGMILELVTLQKAEIFTISISDDEVNSRVNELAELEETLFYEKTFEKYESEDAYKQALYYKMLFEEIAITVKSSFGEKFLINQEILQDRTNDYLSQYTNSDFDGNDLDKEMFWEEVKETYEESLLTTLTDLYFKVWQYKVANSSDIICESYKNDDLFKKCDYTLTPDSLNFKNETYELLDVSVKEINERFDNYFCFSNFLQETYGEINGKAVHISDKDVRSVYATIGTDSPIIVKIIIAPVLSFYNGFKGNEIITSRENGLNKIEYMQSELGIYYTLMGNVEHDELNNILKSSLPYSIVTNK